jgi:alpha-L-arabinofuranosidase
VWDPERAPGEQGAEELYTLSDALAVAVWLNVFVRQSRHLGMANIAQSVNVISPGGDGGRRREAGDLVAAVAVQQAHARLDGRMPCVVWGV